MYCYIRLFNFAPLKTYNSFLNLVNLSNNIDIGFSIMRYLDLLVKPLVLCFAI